MTLEERKRKRDYAEKRKKRNTMKNMVMMTIIMMMTTIMIKINYKKETSPSGLRKNAKTSTEGLKSINNKF